MYRFLLCAVLAAPLFILSPAQAATDPHADIAAANRRYIDALRSGHYADMAADYEKNGRFISSKREIVGRENIARFFAARSAGVRLVSGSCTTSHLEIYGAAATETGACDVTLRRSGRTIRAFGHYVTIWAYNPQERRWRIRFNVIPE